MDGEIRRVSRVDRDPDRWAVCLRGAHPAYIKWETFVKNGHKLRNNRTLPAQVAQGAARDGAGLLAGLGICGRCGRKMWITYAGAGKERHYYSCAGERDRGQVVCWSVSGAALDAAVEDLFLGTMVPNEIDLSLAVEQEIDGQSAALAKQWRARIDQAGYEARRAERRYKAVDPDNRVVARTLEREWEERLTELDEIERQQALARSENRLELTEEDRLRIRALARDLPAVWRASTTSPADRKAMLRLVISAVSLTPVDVPDRMTHVKVQWQGGAVSEMDVPRPSRLYATKTPAATIERIRQMATAGLRDESIAEQLNTERVLTGHGRRWNVWAVRWVRTRSRIKRIAPDAPRRLPLPERHADGRYSIAGLAHRYGVSIHVVRGWIRRGILTGCREVYGQHVGVWWIDLDGQSEVRLAAIGVVPSTMARGRRGNESAEVVL